jgi:sugar phosphate isomerase/epimerase
MVERVARAGYAAVELNAETLPFAKPHVTPETSAQDRVAIVEACKASAIRIPALGAKINMVDENPAARGNAFGFVKGCIDLAADMKVPFVHILSGKPASSVDREDAWRWFADAVRSLTDYGQTKGVELGIEAIVGQLFRSVGDFQRLYADLPGVPFWINFDPSHFIVQDEDPRRVPDEFGDKIRHVHLKDGKGHFPDFSFPPLGQGNIDFFDLVQRLRSVGYDGALSVEYEAQAFGYDLTEQEIVEGEKAFVDQLL